MIIPDINLLLYAYNADLPQHSAAKVWLEEVMSEGKMFAIPWVVICGFIRLSTMRGVFAKPLKMSESCSICDSWLSRSHVSILDPGPNHFSILQNLLVGANANGNLVTDAHIASLAIEYKAELHSNDNDFSRFPGLLWVNPL